MRLHTEPSASLFSLTTEGADSPPFPVGLLWGLPGPLTGVMEDEEGVEDEDKG